MNSSSHSSQHNTPRITPRLSLRDIFLLVIMLLLALPAAVQAQSSDDIPEYLLHMRRDFGYGSNYDVRGNFTITVQGPEGTIQSVTFYMDGQEIAQATAEPFKYSFNTNNYPPGWHDLTAVVETVDGRVIETRPVRKNFLTAEQESEALKRLLLPIGGIVALLMLIGVGSQFLLLRDPKRTAPGAPRNYGIKGGTICPRCERPYPIHIWSINLIGGYLDRCDYCGKWAFVRRRSLADLKAAEEAELLAAKSGESILPGAGARSEEEHLQKMIEESRYIDE